MSEYSLPKVGMDYLTRAGRDLSEADLDNLLEAVRRSFDPVAYRAHLRAEAEDPMAKIDWTKAKKATSGDVVTPTQVAAIVTLSQQGRSAKAIAIALEIPVRVVSRVLKARLPD